MDRKPIPKPAPREKKQPKPLKRSYIKRNPNAKPIKKSNKYIKVNKQPKRNPSIMEEYENRIGYEPHEIYFGRKNRLICFEYGFWVYLSPGEYGDHSKAHNDIEFDLKLKKDCQERFEKTHTREEFIKIIGRNYLD